MGFVGRGASCGQQGFFIHIRHSSDVGKSGNRLIAMLEELFSEKEAAEKKRSLKDGYGLVMSTESERRMDDMCNISSMLGVKERAEGRAEGITEGIAKGRAEGITQGIAQGIAQGRTEGIAQGRAEEIISMGEDFQLSKDAILGKLQEKLGIGALEAEEYWEKYAGGGGATA